ncbi:MAG TPA: retroviral-like aspartic protease family protein [Rhizomicrobium sp.]|nr:retroviral-like aspartic protease family protein [Rhizomicrobium sp.]
MPRVGVLIALLAFALPASRSWAALPAEQPYRIAYHGRLITDVFVDGQGPFSFVIDTASSRSLIFEHVRQKLALPQSQPQRMTIYGINDVADVMAVKPGELRVAGETVRGLTVGVLPDTAGSGPDGVLGVDFLARYFVVLDRGTMQVKLLPPGDESARAYADWTEMQLTPRSLKKFPIQFWYLKTRFNDRALTALFDLGSSTTMMNWEAAERLGLHRAHFAAKYGPPPEMLQDVLGKEAPALRVEGLEVRLPGKSWDKQLVIVADAPVFTYFDLDEQAAAIVGLGLLQNNSLAIDFTGQRLYVGPTLTNGS